MPKLLNTLLILSLISFSLQADKYTLAIYGDNGQVEYWAKNQMPGAKTTQADMDKFYKTILPHEKYELGPFKCVVKVNNKATDLTKQEGFVNFNHILENKEAARILKEADGAVIIGDVLYLETKRLATKKPDPKNPSLQKHTLEQESQWQARLECGWNLFFESLQRVGLAVLKNNKNLKNGGVVTVDSKIEMLAGNHSQDFNLSREEDQVRSINKEPLTKKPQHKEVRVKENDKFFTESPSLIRIQFKSFDIEFLDFNSANLACVNAATEQDYINCHWSPSTISLKQAQLYAYRVAEYIKKFTLNKDAKNVETKRVWRVMRAHHPPLNTEDGDADFYFNDITVFNISSKKAEKVNLWKLMKEKKVNVFLGSHTHAAEVLALPYNYAFKKLDTKGCEGPAQLGCAVAQTNNPFLSGATLSPKCTDGLKYNLPINASHDLNNDMLYVFIFGNSGRSLDALKSGKASVGVMIWARANEYVVGGAKKHAFGFAVAEFTDKSVAITFYENTPDAANKLINAASFTVSNGALPNMAAVGKFIDGKICPVKK